jgi:hypothetical protein
MMIRTWVFLAAAVTLFICIFYIDPTPKPLPPHERQAIPTAITLAALAEKEDWKSLRLYANRRLIVRGDLEKIWINPFGNPVITLMTGAVGMKCVLEGKDKVDLSRLRRGATIYISGMNLMAGTGMQSFETCRLATPAEVEEAKQP